MVKLKWVLVLLMCLCSVLSFAGPKPDHNGGRTPHFGKDAMFAMIAEDLKLTDEQKVKYDKIMNELKEIKEKSQEKKLEEFKSFIGLVNKGSASDADIDAYDKLCADNDIAFQTEIAAKMSEFYSILDPNQQKRFIEKMTMPKPNDKDKNGGKKGKDDPKKHKPPKGKNPPPPNGRPDMGRGDGHRMMPPPPNGRPDMGRGDDRRMPPPDRFADKGNKPHHDGHPHRDGNMKGDHHGKMNMCGGNAQTMMLGAIARDLKLSKEQFETFHRIKGEIRDKMAEKFTKCDNKDKPCKPFGCLTEGQTVEQMQEKIAERVNGGAEARKFALKKYFEFYDCLTDSQKEVVKLKYQYDIAKMSLPNPNDKK